MFKQWFGPKGFTVPYCTIDLQVGGKFLLCMRSPEGREMWNTGTYRDIDPVERLVNTDSLADDKGNVVEMEGMPLETLVTLNLEEEGESRTRMTMTHAGLPEGDGRNGAGEGWRQAFEKLATVLGQEKGKK